MKKYDSAFSSAATRVGAAAKQTAQEYAEKNIPDEPSFTAVLATRIKDSLSGFSKGGVSWSAKILSSHGPNTEESRFGADVLGALSLNLPGYWKRMQAQCNTMLNFTSDSYVFIYSLNGVFVVPAISVAACQAVEDLHTLHPKNLSAFYKEHFMCFVGDRAIDSASPRVLDNLLARVAFEITASASNDRDLFTDDEGDA